MCKTNNTCKSITKQIKGDIYSLGTIKASQVVVLNEDLQSLPNENSYKQRDPHPQIEFDLVEKHIHVRKMCVALNEDHF